MVVNVTELSELSLYNFGSSGEEARHDYIIIGFNPPPLRSNWKHYILHMVSQRRRQCTVSVDVGHAAWTMQEA